MKAPVKALTLLLALPLVLSGCGGGDDAPASSGSVATTGDAGDQTATVDMNDALEFDPTTVEARVGTVVLDVKNVGKVPHNLVFDEEALGKTGTISGGESEPLKVVFDKTGTFTFVCTFHSGMTGKVVVS